MIKLNKFKWGKSSVTRKATTSLYIQACADLMLARSPIDCTVPWMGGKRTGEEQNAIFKAGNSKCDGFDKLSNHQREDENGLGMAIDIVPYISKKGASYEADGRFGIIGVLMLDSWERLKADGEIPEELYLHWGGLWTNKKAISLGWDPAHYEIRNEPQKPNIK